MKKIVEHEKKQQQSSEMKLSGKSEIFSSRSFYAALPPSPVTTLLRKYANRNVGFPIDQPSSFFHPPSA